MRRPTCCACAAVLSVANWIVPLDAQCIRARSGSSVTQCAEEDNVNIPVWGNAASLVVEATHPTYAIGSNSCAANFANCQEPADPVYPFASQDLKIHDDGDIVVWARRLQSWWLPRGMTASAGSGTLADAHQIVFYKQLRPGDYRQFLVLYSDGNMRLIPLPRAPQYADVCFGSSVIVGPAATAARPFAQVAAVSYNNVAKSLTLQYGSGGSAVVSFLQINETVTRVGVLVNSATGSLPFVTFRSMWVADGNADVDHVQWTDSAGSARDEPVLSFLGGGSREWFFHRNVRSVHNTNAPDIRIRMTDASTSCPAGLSFVAVSPCRVADTRAEPGVFGGPILGAGSTRSFPIPSSACNIPAGAQAYSLNVTAVPASPLGYLASWPAGPPRPFVSTLNSPGGSVVANAAIVSAGALGAVNVYATDATHVILDVNGYFAPAATESQSMAFYPVTPCRIADTRDPPGGAFGGPIMASGATRSFPVPSSTCGIPSNAQAYAMNVTVVPSGPLWYLTAWPAGQTQPLVSTLNSFDGRITANAAIVPAGTGGAVSIYVAGHSDVILDVNGYFAPAGGNGALRLYPIGACRVADTRNPASPLGGPAISANSSRDLPVLGSACGIPSTAKAYSLNVTVVPYEPLGYLTVWPAGLGRPLVSTLNSFEGGIVANAAIVPAGTNGAVSVFSTGKTDLVLDINGYFAP